MEPAEYLVRDANMGMRIGVLSCVDGDSIGTNDMLEKLVHYLSLLDCAEDKAIKIHPDSVMNALMPPNENFDPE
jgi:hypothetical protein